MGRTGPQRAALGPALEGLLHRSDAQANLSRDPLSFVRAWPDPADQEVAAVLAASLAFGRVAAFWPVTRALMDQAAEAGGPRAWVLGFDPARARALDGLVYRWLRGPDLALLAMSLGVTLGRWGRLGRPFEEGHAPGHPDLGPAMVAGIDALRGAALEAAASLGRPAGAYTDLPRGFRSLLASPRDGSPCKRWCMLLRWMVRPPGPRDRSDGLDLGLWALPPGKLVIPLDTHVHRLALLLGLTRRRDASWQTALEITAALRRQDPADPVRFDFALAHLGISGACTVRIDDPTPPPPGVCSACSLVGLCRVGRRQVSKAPTRTERTS